MKQKNKRNILIAALCTAVIASCGIGSLSAYFTDGDTKTNEFTVGKVSIDMQEPGYPGDDSPEVTNLVPNEEVKKDPQIKNDGVNDAYVFMEVFVPYQDGLITANDDGTRNAPASTELFSYTVNDGWISLEDSETADSTSHMKAGYVRHLYAWGDSTKMTTLVGSDNSGKEDKEGNNSTDGAVTSPLFDGVRFANIVEDQGLEGSEPHIIINSYAIQATAVNNNDKTNDGTSNSDITHQPEAVWDVLEAQAEERVGHQGDTFFEHGTEDKQDKSSGESKEVSTWDDAATAGN